MAKKEQNTTAKAEELNSETSAPVLGDNAIPTGSEETVGEAKDEDLVETPPAVSEAPETLQESKPKSGASLRLKVSALVSGQMFSAGMNADEIPEESRKLIPSKYFEEMK